MRIFLYLKHFPAAGDWLHEGTTKAVHGLASGLAACGVHTIVVCEGSQSSQIQASAGYTIACFKRVTRSSAPSFRIAPELKAFLRETALDGNSLVILNGIFHSSVYALSRFLYKSGVPYIIAPHDPYHPSIFQTNRYLKLLYWHLLEKTMLQRASAIQILDPRHAQWLRRLQIDTPTISVPNGFELSDVITASQIQWDAGTELMSSQPNLFFLGRLDRYHKGLDILIDAVASLRTTTPVHLTIQGPDWGDRAQLIDQVQALNLTSKVHFLEPNYDQSPAKLAAQYEVFCLTSRFEGFGLVALEAMLAGRVLIVSEVAGIAPHVMASGCGVVVQPTIAGVQQGIQELLQVRSQWPEMGLKGRRHVLENLHWLNIATQALDAYSKLLPFRPDQLTFNPD